MGFFSILFKRDKNEEIDNFINNRIKRCQLARHHLQFMMALVDNKSILNFYKTNEDNKEEWQEFISSLNCDYSLIKKNTIIIINDGIVNVILFNWSGLYDVVDAFKTDEMSETRKRNLFIVKFGIKQSLARFTEGFYSVLKDFNVVLKNDDIELYEDIIPDKALYKNKIVDIPQDSHILISKLIIYADPQGCVTSMRLDKKHPNADEKGWYCMGDLKSVILSTNNMNTLISNIKCYRLDDCYWRPTGFRKWFK